MLACGIVENKATIFLQSQVPQHTELNWILSCLTTNPQLTRLPQFNEKSAQTQNPSTGLLLYPVLQAADILIHKLETMKSFQKLIKIVSNWFFFCKIEEHTFLVARINCSNCNWQDILHINSIPHLAKHFRSLNRLLDKMLAVGYVHCVIQRRNNPNLIQIVKVK